MHTWYLYDPEDGLEEFATQDEAVMAAKMKIQTYLDGNEWIDGVERIAVFQKTHGMRDVSNVLMHADWQLFPVGQ